MVAPYAPELISPVRSQGAGNTPTIFQIRFRAPTSEAAGDYRVMRRSLPGGSVEYLNNAGNWQAGDTYRTAIANIEDGEIIEVESATGWTDDTVYEWWANFKGGSGGAEVGADSSTAVFVSVTPIVPAPEVEAAPTDSRPVVRWSNDPSTRKQRSYQVAIYTEEAFDDAEFDPSAPGWQEQAVWIMTTPFVASDVFRQQVGTDLDPSTEYRALVRIVDRYGVASDWTESNSFTTNFTPPPEPIVVATPMHSLGVMRLDVDAAFNLVDNPSSAFNEPGHGWINLYNTEVEHDTVNENLLCTGVGRTFDEADAAFTDFDDWDTGHTTFAQQALARTSFVTESIITLRKDDSYLIPVVVGEDYSMICTVTTVGYSATGKCMIRWLTAGLSEVSVSTGSNVTLLPNTPTEVPSGGFEAPATAAFAELRVSVTTVPYQQFRMDNVAFARSDSVVWTPGGLGVDLKFIISRRVGGGDWEYVWGATREDPLAAQDASLTTAVIDDRACPMGRSDVEYRVQVITSASGKVIASPVAIISAPELFTKAWFLRCYDAGCPDVRLRAATFTFGDGSSNVVSYLQNKQFGIVQESGDAAPHDISVSAWLFDKEEYEAIRELFRRKKTLFIHRNIGDGFYIRITGVSRYRQHMAVGPNNRPRNVHTVDFQGEVVGLPEELIA